MALTLKDILQLQSLQGFRLHAGQKGLSRYITSAGIGDYEFCSDIDYPRETAFEPDSLVLSSLLFAKDRPELLLPAVQQLYEAGVCGLAYKTVIFQQLPETVLDFCDTHAFPLFSFGSDAYFENIIYEVMNAVRADDSHLLTESNIRSMIENDFPKSQISLLAKSLSLAFKQHVMGVYIKYKSGAAPQEAFALQAERCLKNLYLNRNLNDKALLCLYNGGIFALLTAQQAKPETFEVILSQLLDFLHFEEMPLWVSRSEVHLPFESLDLCFRESYQTFLASVAEERSFGTYSKIGTYRFLIPCQNSEAMATYANDLLAPLLARPEYLETARQFVRCGGDLLLTADHFGCHPNTIRYRMQKIKALLGFSSETEQDFYAILAPALRLHLLQTQQTLQTLQTLHAHAERRV